MERECATCKWFTEDEDGERCLLLLAPAMCCDPACEDYEEA